MTTNTAAKQLVVDQTKRLNEGDIEGAAALMAEDCISHSALPEAQGRAGFRMIMTKLREAFPDLSYSIEDIVSEGDKVVFRSTMTGTHKGALAFVRLPVPATGKAVRFEQIHIARVVNGKIVEHWLTTDSLAMFRQLGLQITPPA